MKSRPASEAREVWADIRNALFSDSMVFRIVQEQAKYFQDPIYTDLRNTSAAKILELIDSLCDPNQSGDLRRLVETAPISQQAFLYERFLYVDDHLAQLAELEFSYEDKLEDFLRFGLVDLWDSRPH